MLFGSDEMKEMLISAYNNPDLYQEAMDELYASVKYYTLNKLVVGFAKHELGADSKAITTDIIDPQDYEDIINDVFCGVLVSLDGFILNLIADTYKEAQRQAWLRRIIYRTIVKYLKQKNKWDHTTEIDENSDGDGKDIEDDVLDDVRYKQMYLALVRVVCRAPYKPEKILAYIYNVVIFHEIAGRRKNSSSLTTSKYMNGKTLFELKNLMIDAFARVFDVTIDKKTIEPLLKLLGDEVPTEKGDAVCNVTPKLVTDWSNRMKTYVFKFRAEILGEEGESDVRKK